VVHNIKVLELTQMALKLHAVIILIKCFPCLEKLYLYIKVIKPTPYLTVHLHSFVTIASMCVLMLGCHYYSHVHFTFSDKKSKGHEFVA
jgi:hypothetical protein